MTELVTYPPCPFCGRNDLGCVLIEPHNYVAVLQDPTRHKAPELWCIECPGCSVNIVGDTKEACVAAWSKRVNPFSNKTIEDARELTASHWETFMSESHRDYAAAIRRGEKDDCESMIITLKAWQIETMR